MAERVFITGYGIVSSIGLNSDETLSSVFSGKTGIGEITILETLHKGKLPLAEVKKSTAELLALAGYPGKKDLTRTAILGIIAATEAVHSARLIKEDLLHTGFISATTVGGMDRSERFYEKFLQAPNNSGSVYPNSPNSGVFVFPTMFNPVFLYLFTRSES